MMTGVARRTSRFTRAQFLALLAGASVPVGIVLCVSLYESAKALSPVAVPILLVSLVGPFVLLPAPLFLGILALYAAKPQESLFKTGRIVALVALSTAFLLSLPFAAFLLSALLFGGACAAGQCL